MFLFFFLVNRKGIITFCGSHTDVKFDKDGPDGKECFRLYEDGYYKEREIVTRHPNILKSVLIGKKGWGLWVQEWTNGISDWSFTEDEIFDQFENIEIPKSFIIDFYNVLEKKKMIRNRIYYEELKNKI